MSRPRPGRNAVTNGVANGAANTTAGRNGVTNGVGNGAENAIPVPVPVKEPPTPTAYGGRGSAPPAQTTPGACPAHTELGRPHANCRACRTSPRTAAAAAERAAPRVDSRTLAEINDRTTECEHGTPPSTACALCRRGIPAEEPS